MFTDFNKFCKSEGKIIEVVIKKRKIEQTKKTMRIVIMAETEKPEKLTIKQPHKL